MRKITSKSLDTLLNTHNRTLVMGILNITPDSFYDGGMHNTSVETSLEHAMQMQKDGADIIDIGGYSTRPGYEDISTDIELNRILPILKLIKLNSDIPTSIDTFRASVADKCLHYGADLINDIGGLLYDVDMAKVVAKYDAYVCIMHNVPKAQFTIHNSQFTIDDKSKTECRIQNAECRIDDLPFHEIDGERIVKQICTDLEHSIDIALSASISKDKIILDPGIGFHKDVEQNLSVLKYLKHFKKELSEYKWLLGASNKSLFSKFGLEKHERIEATVASSVHASSCGFDIVRVHNVLENKRALMLADAMYKCKMQNAKCKIKDNFIFDDSCENSKKLRTVALGLGTNIGDRDKNLRDAIDRISEVGNVEKVAKFYNTEPYGPVVQDDFLNTAVLLNTSYSPLEILKKIKDIEKSMGRVPSERWGPRLIDIDILLIEDLVFHHESIDNPKENLDIPHAQMHLRKFVLEPLLDICPQAIHPVFNVTVEQLYKNLIR